LPVEADEQAARARQERYTIYCQPCHDARGDGTGILFQRGQHPDRVVPPGQDPNYPDGQIFDVITNGSGLMPATAGRCPRRTAGRSSRTCRELQQKRAVRPER
jgi:hypothetical protein